MRYVLRALRSQRRHRRHAVPTSPTEGRRTRSRALPEVTPALLDLLLVRLLRAWLDEEASRGSGSGWCAGLTGPAVAPRSTTSTGSPRGRGMSRTALAQGFTSFVGQSPDGPTGRLQLGIRLRPTPSSARSNSPPRPLLAGAPCGPRIHVLTARQLLTVHQPPEPRGAASTRSCPNGRSSPVRRPSDALFTVTVSAPVTCINDQARAAATPARVTHMSMRHVAELTDCRLPHERSTAEAPRRQAGHCSVGGSSCVTHVSV